MSKPSYSEKYKLVTLESGIHSVAGFGRVDLDQLSLEEAELLYAQKFPFLALKEKEAKAPTAPKA